MAARPRRRRTAQLRRSKGLRRIPFKSDQKEELARYLIWDYVRSGRMPHDKLLSLRYHGYGWAAILAMVLDASL